jgi:hypothetical protein
MRAAASQGTADAGKAARIKKAIAPPRRTARKGSGAAVSSAGREMIAALRRFARRIASLFSRAAFRTAFACAAFARAARSRARCAALAAARRAAAARSADVGCVRTAGRMTTGVGATRWTGGGGAGWGLGIGFGSGLSEAEAGEAISPAIPSSINARAIPKYFRDLPSSATGYPSSGSYAVA